MDVEKIIAIASGRESRYIRKGGCLRCGQCCSGEDCKNFKYDGNCATCKIHDDIKREEKCRIFPANPPIVFKNCGYYFIDKITGKKLGYKEVE